MFEFNTLLFLFLVFIGAVVQTVSGFALGIIIVTGATLFNLQEIAYSAAVISIVSLVNTTIALRKNYRQIDTTYLKWLAWALLPGLFIGILLLTYLSQAHYTALRTLLGLLVIISGLLLLIKPKQAIARTGLFVTSIFGLIGGIFGGLYSAGGSAFAYYLYRQPIPLISIRATLLAVLVISTSVRIIIVAIPGHITLPVLITALVSIPIVIVATEITSRLLWLIPDAVVRNLVVLLMTITGMFLLLN